MSVLLRKAPHELFGDKAVRINFWAGGKIFSTVLSAGKIFENFRIHRKLYTLKFRTYLSFIRDFNNIAPILQLLSLMNNLDKIRCVVGKKQYFIRPVRIDSQLAKNLQAAQLSNRFRTAFCQGNSVKNDFSSVKKRVSYGDLSYYAICQKCVMGCFSIEPSYHSIST